MSASWAYHEIYCVGCGNYCGVANHYRSTWDLPECAFFRVPSRQEARNAFMNYLRDLDPDVWTPGELGRQYGVKGETIRPAIQYI